MIFIFIYLWDLIFLFNFYMAIVFLNVNIKIFHYDDWTMFEKKCWITILSLFRIVEIKYEWALYTCNIYFNINI